MKIQKKKRVVVVLLLVYGRFLSSNAVAIPTAAITATAEPTMVPVLSGAACGAAGGTGVDGAAVTPTAVSADEL